MRLNTSRGALRREAFEKLAVLSAQAPPSHAAHQDITRLCSLYKTPETSNGVAKGPIGIRELEVLIALCRASSSIESVEHAERLLQQITPYLSEAQTQTFRPSPFLRHVHPSPWEVLVQEVASALLNIGIKHSSLRSQVVTSIINTIDAYVHQGQNIDRLDTSEDSALDIDNASRTITFSVSLLGLLSALAEKPQVCTVQERASIIYKLQTLYSEKFMVTIEGTLSSQTPQSLSGYEGVDGSSLEKLTELLTEIVSLLDADADYLQVSSAWQQQLAFSTKASCLISFLCCSLANEDIADADVLMAWLDGILTDPVQLADERLASVTLKCMAILAKTSKAFASNLARSLPRFIVQGRMTSDTVVIAANCLADVLQLLPQDLVISTLYSLGNVLSTGPSTNRANTSLFIDGNGTANGTMNGSVTSYTQQPTGSSISLVTNDDEETVLVHAAVVEAIVAIARKCHDERITALAISMLVQKIGRVNLAVDAKIIMGSAALGSQSEPNDFRPLLKLYARLVTDALASDNNVSLQAVMDARMLMAKSIPPTSPLYEIYLTYLLDGIVSTSDVTSRDTKTVVMDKLAVGQISQILPPLAALAAFMPYEYTQFEDPEMVSALSRDAWFNLIAHDFSLGSSFAKKHQQELQTLAWYTPSLIDSNKADTQESGIDLNTVLRRGMSPQHAVQLKSQLISALPTHETDIKSLNYAELTFLNAAHLVAVLRAQSGDCTRTLEYFLDPKFKSGALSNCLLGVALSAVDTYLALTMTGRSQTFAAANLAQQLARLLESCCHRIDKVQQVATLAADRIIDQVPSSLCQRTSLFALLELLSLMWISCLEAETDEYECKSFYNSTLVRPGFIEAQNADQAHTTNNYMQRRKSLLIGINYTGSDNALKGCHEDVDNVAEFIKYRGYEDGPHDQLVLRDDLEDDYYPTGHNLLAAIDWLVSEENTICFFHYSGHGGQIDDPQGRHPSGLLDTIVPVDFEENGQIDSDTLHQHLVSRLHPSSSLFLILDCCHSGSTLQLPFIYRSDDGGNVQQVDAEGIGKHLMKDAKHLITGGFSFNKEAQTRDLYAGATSLFRSLKHRRQATGLETDDFTQE
ncbi:phosphatidylinositol 3 [Aureobasidium pullulans]|nr:phosphatidylinositol 3 [Aureobasidium pullulans]